ncbi:MAG: hypothetical protein PQJ59_05505 [Spirochaetales bacterium]|nr:hypothetical protein [Spirochaetales bacterium]
MIENAFELIFPLSNTALNGLTLFGTIFFLIALVGTIRSGGLHRLFFCFFAFFLTLFSLSLQLPGLITIKGHTPLIPTLLFPVLLLLYNLYYHFSLKARHHSRGVITLTALFIYLIGFTLLSLLAPGSGTFLNLVRKADWTSLALGISALFLLVRLIVAFCFHQDGSAGATVSFLLFLIPTLAPLFLRNSLNAVNMNSFALFTLPLLSLWEFIRLFTRSEGSSQPKTKAEQPVGHLREQLSDSRTKEKDLNDLLTDREEELGALTAKARKISRRLLPSVIHHDGLWEVTTFFNPSSKPLQRELFDFYYTYGRKIAGISLFDTPEEPEGALYGALLKKEWTENFNETPSLASLYRRIDGHLKEIFDGTELTGAVLKLNEDKLEYTGYGNPPLYYINEKLNKCAPLIQDKAHEVGEIKSYSIPCFPGDGLLICNETFLNKKAPITGQAFSKESLPQVLEGYKGASVDLVRELIDERNKFLGKKEESDILVIYVKRKA